MLTVIGGNGFVGGGISRHAINRGMQVMCVSRSGKSKDQSYWSGRMEHVKGDALNPSSIKSYLEKSRYIVHCVGVLDAKSDQEYISQNRDSAIRVSQCLQELFEQDKIARKFVLISSSHYPPFMKRYLETKEEAETFVRDKTTFDYIILKPGFIYSPKQKPWTQVLTSPLKIVSSMVGTKPICAGIAKFDSPISLNEVSLATLAALEDTKITRATLLNAQIASIANNYKQKHTIIFTV